MYQMQTLSAFHIISSHIRGEQRGFTVLCRCTIYTVIGSFDNNKVIFSNLAQTSIKRRSNEKRSWGGGVQLIRLFIDI